MTEPRRDTVAAHFAAAAVARLERRSCMRVLAAAGIREALLTQPAARVPAPAFAALWLAVANELDDEFFGLDARRMKVGSFALVTQAAAGGGTLDGALRRVLRGFGVLLDDIGGELRVTRGGEAAVVLTNRIAEADARRFAGETMLVMVHGLMCWLAGRRLPLRGVDFAWPRPAHAAEYEAMFSGELAFDAAATALRFDARWLAQPVAPSEGALKSFLRTAPQSVFVKYRNEDSWTARVRRRLRTSTPAGWPGLEALAAELGVAVTTLRRRLGAEGTSWQRLKDELRRDAAYVHLRDSTLPITEIAALLGYREPSAFHKAFKKWSGLQPGEYRLRAANQASRACQGSA